mgnify:CR=1 FL=1
MPARHERLLIGVDDVGSGAIAGPYIACAVALDPDVVLPRDVRDSKLLSREQREALEPVLSLLVRGYAFGELDEWDAIRVGYYWASFHAMAQAVKKLCEECGLSVGSAQPVIVDGLRFLPGIPHASQKPRAHADRDFPCVSIASILAKVWRDREMEKLGQPFPEYGWAKNAGYGVPEHLAALREHGVTYLHRLGMRPLKAILEERKAAGLPIYPPLIEAGR